ncbi:MAG: glutamyl-tRNA reductase, partial [Blautia sp.]|nr:glutamyl-tRNA reductase [Blautia sp.]
TSPNYTLFYDKVAPCQTDHPMYLFDLAVPRDIDPEIGKLPQYTIYDLDDFRSEENPENQEAYIRADAILEKEMNEFWMWLNYRDVIPRIQEIRQESVDDMNLRLGKIIRKLPLEETQKEKLIGDFDTAAGKVIANLFYAMRDSLDGETFRKCVDAVEAYYEKDPS